MCLMHVLTYLKIKPDIEFKSRLLHFKHDVFNVCFPFKARQMGFYEWDNS